MPILYRSPLHAWLRRSIWLLATCGLLACQSRNSSAARPTPPKLIVMGGGWGPEGTQASLEAHVRQLNAVLTPERRQVLFAAGTGKVRAVQEIAPIDPISEVLGRVFDRMQDLHVRYRPTQIEPKAAARKQTFLETLVTAKKHTDVTVFGVGHGGAPTEQAPATLELWGPNDRVSVPELAQALDRAPGPGRIALVLGHCHSGAFTDVMFSGARPEGGLATPTRCAFAAVPADREAAGCTPDLQDPSAQSYMAMIARALGQSSTDLNKDRVISLAEAHTFARLNDQTVDVPVSSSELWLLERLGDRMPDITRWPWPQGLEGARVTEKAVVENGLPSAERAQGPKGVALALETLRKEIEQAEDGLLPILDERDLTRRRLVDRVLARWPELVNPYHPVSRRLLGTEAKAIVAFIKAQSEWSVLEAIDRRIEAKDKEIWTKEKRAARYERWLRAVQIIANEAMLRAQRKPTVTAAFDALLECEAMVP